MADAPVNIRTPRNEKGPRYESFYCNNVAYAMSPVDFVFTFGEVINTGTDIYVEQRARVTMSPAQAKVLRDILSERIKIFESNVGEIKIPGGFSQTFSATNEG